MIGIFVALLIVVFVTLWVVVGIAMDCDPFWRFRTRVYLHDLVLDRWIRSCVHHEGAQETAYVYPLTKVGQNVLHPEGRTSGTSYIDRWKR